MAILIAVLAGSFLFYKQGKAEAPVIEKPKTTTEKISEKLPKEFLAIARAESGMNPRAKNWNCWYGEVSRSCDKADRPRAWSVDCGLFQKNVLGTECPERLFDVDININETASLYESRGFQPWSASMHVWTN